MSNSIDIDLKSAINANQKLKSRILGILFVVIFLIQLIFLYKLNSNREIAESFDKKVIFFGPLFLIIMSFLEFYMSYLLSKNIQLSESRLKLVQYSCAFLEVSFPTFVLLFAGNFIFIVNNQNYDIRFLLNSPPMLFYFIFIILSALQLDFRLCLLVGLVAGLEYLFTSYFLMTKFAQPLFFDYVINIGKAVFIGISGLLSGIVAGKIKESVIESLKSKNDLIHNLDFMVKEKTIEINNKNLLLEEKNKDITDSINYAQRIQFAKFPKREEINMHLANHFILFRPKDIVSGDFYFFHKKNEMVYIAAADCTGHGVPGAFMSIISIEKLEEAVLECKDFSEILSFTNKKIRASLKQNQHSDSTRDGMDIALCAINPNTGQLKYTGANRPLWVIRRGGKEVLEIKATKKAIGGLTADDEVFETHNLTLQQGDCIYFGSDGYADTFSGLTGKKLTTKKFKDLLLEIQHLSMKEQEHYLDKFLDDWKLQTEQIDDILVIGIRI